MSRPLGGDAARLAVATRTATTTATRTAGHLVLMSPVPPKEAVRVASYPEMLMAVRRWLSLPAAIVVLASAGFVALGLQPMPPDVPDRVVSTPPRATAACAGRSRPWSCATTTRFGRSAWPWAGYSTSIRSSPEPTTCRARPAITPAWASPTDAAFRWGRAATGWGPRVWRARGSPAGRRPAGTPRTTRARSGTAAPP